MIGHIDTFATYHNMICRLFSHVCSDTCHCFVMTVSVTKRVLQFQQYVPCFNNTVFPGMGMPMIKTVFVFYGNPYTGKTESLHWNAPMFLMLISLYLTNSVFISLHWYSLHLTWTWAFLCLHRVRNTALTPHLITPRRVGHTSRWEL